MELSTEKTKISVFEKRRGKTDRRWTWGEDLEKVKEMRYLGYIVQKNGGAEKHMEERKRPATIAMRQTWSLGERTFKEDYKRRVSMFESLVSSVALFGAEIWGWKEEEKLDTIQRKYVKWILGLDKTTPNYIVEEETRIKSLKIEAMKRQ